VIEREKPEYILPDFISYPSSEDECGNVTGTKVPKRKKKSSKVIYVRPKEQVLAVNVSDSDMVSFLQRKCLRTTHVPLKRL
jgi:hypothetical protein